MATARLEAKMDAGFGDVRELRADMRALNVTPMRIGGGIMAGLVGVIAAVLVGG